MSWQDYFEDCFLDYYEHGDPEAEHDVIYRYKDQLVIKLPDNLPMPPTTDLNGLFCKCDSLQDISALAKWDVSNVTHMDSMFCGCHQLQDITALSYWNVSSVRHMETMFSGCKQLKDITPLANWDVSNVRLMSGMFLDCKQLEDITALSEWNVSNVMDMNCMFSGCEKLQDITALANWDVYNVKNTSSMFDRCNLLPQILRDNATYMYTYISKYKYDTYQKATEQQIDAFQKRIAELESYFVWLENNLARLSMRVDLLISRSVDDD